MVQRKQHWKYNHIWNIHDFIILDSDSAIKGTFINSDLIDNVKFRKKPLHMFTNSVTNKMSLQGEVNTFGDLWYDLK